MAYQQLYNDPAAMGDRPPSYQMPVPIAQPPPVASPPQAQSPPDEPTVDDQIVSKAPMHYQQMENRIVAHAGLNQAPCHYDGVLTANFCTREACKRWICVKHARADVKWTPVSAKPCGQSPNSGCPCPGMLNYVQQNGASICFEGHELEIKKPTIDGEVKCFFCDLVTTVICAKQECKKSICVKHLQHDAAWDETLPERGCGCGNNAACWCTKTVNVVPAIGHPICSEHVVDRARPNGYPRTVFNWIIIILTAIGVLAGVIIAATSGAAKKGN